MATLAFPAVGSGGVTMDANFFPLPEYAYRATQTSTNFTLFYSANTYDKFTGSGIHYDGSGYPYDGLIKSWVYVEGGKTIFSVTNLNMPVSEYMSYFYADDWQGLLWAAFDGSDAITGTAGQDDLYGFDGSDVIKAGNAYDIVFGDAGADKLYGEAGDDDLYGGTGDDTLDGAAGIDWLFGGNDRDLLLGGADADELYGDAGDDTLDGGTGADYFEGGRGNDLYILDNFGDIVDETGTLYDPDDEIRTSVTIGSQIVYIEHYTYTGKANWDFSVYAWGENNKITGGSGNDTLGGQDGNDTLNGNAGNDILNAGTGEDVLIGGLGSDKLRGGEGNDTYYVDSGDSIEEEGAASIDDRVIAGATVDLAILGGGAIEHAELGSGKFSANLFGNGSNNILVGNGGANLLDGRGGADTLYGGIGNDIYVVDDPADTIFEEGASGGIDVIRAVMSVDLTDPALFYIENVELQGGSKIDATGNFNNNHLTGNSGENRLDGGIGKDTLAGGGGNDTYVVDHAGDLVVEAANGGTDTIETWFTTDLLKKTNIESVTLLGDADIDAMGTAGWNALTGNAGDNLIDGRKGADLMRGGAGNDIYVVDDLWDIVDEGVNDDAWDWVKTTARIVYGIGGIEAYTYYGALTWVFSAGDLDNRIESGSGADALNGQAGNDTIVAGAGNDVVFGGIGNDFLDSGLGDDLIRGGAGNDIYVIGSLKDLVDEEENLDSDDRVISSVTVSLSALSGGAIEHAVLTGSAAINATGNAGANELTGNDGANLLDGQGGADTMTGGKGNDTYVVDDIGDVVVESIAGGAGGIDLVRSAIDFDLSLHVNIEKLILTGSAIEAIGNSLANTLTGNAEGNLLDGAAGKDTMIGGAGDDTYIVDMVGDVVSETLANNKDGGIDTVRSAITFSLAALSNVDNLVLTGGLGINGTGNGLGNALTGNDWNNSLNGGAGDDTLHGGVGLDKLTGGSGSDRFDYDTLADGGDTITDFQLGAAGDILDLSDLLIGISYAGSDAFGDGLILFEKAGASTVVSLDTDGFAGPGTKTLLVTLMNVTLNAADSDNYNL